jgi:hypothetical protein
MYTCLQLYHHIYGRSLRFSSRVLSEDIASMIMLMARPWRFDDLMAGFFGTSCCNSPGSFKGLVKL